MSIPDFCTICAPGHASDRGICEHHGKRVRGCWDGDALLPLPWPNPLASEDLPGYPEVQISKLCGPKSLADQVRPIRDRLIRETLDRGVSPRALADKINECLFHALPWVDGIAAKILDGLDVWAAPDADGRCGKCGFANFRYEQTRGGMYGYRCVNCGVFKHKAGTK